MRESLEKKQSLGACDSSIAQKNKKGNSFHGSKISIHEMLKAKIKLQLILLVVTMFPIPIIYEKEGVNRTNFLI